MTGVAGSRKTQPSSRRPKDGVSLVRPNSCSTLTSCMLEIAFGIFFVSGRSVSKHTRRFATTSRGRLSSDKGEREDMRSARVSSGWDLMKLAKASEGVGFLRLLSAVLNFLSTRFPPDDEERERAPAGDVVLPATFFARFCLFFFLGRPDIAAVVE